MLFALEWRQNRAKGALPPCVVNVNETKSSAPPGATSYDDAAAATGDTLVTVVST